MYTYRRVLTHKHYHNRCASVQERAERETEERMVQEREARHHERTLRRMADPDGGLGFRV